jgi:hypothetical protein
MNVFQTIPKEDQLRALAEGLPGVYRLIEQFTGGSVMNDFRPFITVSKAELIAYLRLNPGYVKQHVHTADAVRSAHDFPVLIEEDGRWIVCWMEHGKRVDAAFYDDPVEATANYLMAYW